jgi:hypothetical protein
VCLSTIYFFIFFFDKAYAPYLMEAQFSLNVLEFMWLDALILILTALLLDFSALCIWRRN